MNTYVIVWKNGQRQPVKGDTFLKAWQEAGLADASLPFMESYFRVPVPIYPQEFMLYPGKRA